MSEPRTDAGRRLLASDFDTTGWGPRMVRRHVADAILAIEREAAAAERERLRAAVEALGGTVVLGGRGIGTVHEPTRAAILALLGVAPDASGEGT